jgi:hypothetical protein
MSGRPRHDRPIGDAEEQETIAPRDLANRDQREAFEGNADKSHKEQRESDGQWKIRNLRSEEKSGDEGKGEGRQHWPPSVEGRENYPK